MKMGWMMAAGAAVMATAACASSEPASYYANPVDACANEETQEERDACMKNVVADVALSVKREKERKPPR
jgi:uncharacterized lipoprotein YmbA